MCLDCDMFMYTCTLFNAVGQNVLQGFIVCGVVPLFDDEGWKLVSISVCNHSSVSAT